ncbi:MAG: hypothetical protein R6X35_06775 [Candidatus Krumholzibacteriia bacterium]|uniref:hypothetical protein n=1 Tax=Halomonas sp. 3H TaxID=2952527 RepID=UPI0020B7A549|nr:hypothetical protein [Halomonas sp. 3H]
MNRRESPPSPDSGYRRHRSGVINQTLTVRSTVIGRIRDTAQALGELPPTGPPGRFG